MVVKKWKVANLKTVRDWVLLSTSVAYL